MPTGLNEVVPTGGGGIAPRLAGGELPADAEAGSPRVQIPSERELSLGRQLEYAEAVKQEEPREPSIWQQARQILQEMDPREITRDCPRFPLFLLSVSSALGAFDLTQFLGP